MELPTCISELDMTVLCSEMGFYLYYAELFEEDVLLKLIPFLNENLHFT